MSRASSQARASARQILYSIDRCPSDACPFMPAPALDLRSSNPRCAWVMFLSALRQVTAARWACPPSWFKIALISPKQPHQLALNLHAIWRQDAHLVAGVGGLERDRGAASAEALERRLLLVDQGDDDVAGVGGLGAAEQRDVAVEDAGVDHGIAAHFQREMIAGREQVGRHVDGVAAVLDRLDRRAGG